MRLVLPLFTLLVLWHNLQARVVTSQCPGYWYDRGTWDLDSVPVNGDTVVISNYVVFRDSVHLYNNEVTIDSGATLCGSSPIWFKESVLHVYGTGRFYSFTGESGSIHNYSGEMMVAQFNISGGINLSGGLSLGPVPACDEVPITCATETRDTIVTPTSGKVRVTLTKASASLVSDVYLISPENFLLIENNLTNVGTTHDTVFSGNSVLEFGIVVHGPGGDYTHLSNSKYALVETLSDSVWTIRFEDLPDSTADWDFNDVELLVELLYVPIPPDLSLTAPAGNEEVIGGDTLEITWDSQGEIDSVLLEYSLNGEWMPIATAANTGTFLWEVPAADISDVYVRVSTPDRAVEDSHDLPLEIFAEDPTGIFSAYKNTYKKPPGWAFNPGAEVQIYDVKGKWLKTLEIHSGEDFKTTAHLEKGLYILAIRTENKIQTQKWVVLE